MKYVHALGGWLYLCILLLTSQSITAQCDGHCHIACRGQINVSLGTGCVTEFTPWMGAKGITPADSLCYSAQVFDIYDQPIPGNLMDISNINQLLKYKVTEADCNNYCWGTVLVEYKLGPQIACPPDMTIECAALDYLEIPSPGNVCAAVTVSLLNEVYTDLPCDSLFKTKLTRSYRAVDEYGHSGTCSHNIYLKRIDPSKIIFPGHTVYSCSDPRIKYDGDGLPIPFFHQTSPDSLSLYGVPFLCTTEMVTPYHCPSIGVIATGGTGSGTGSGSMGSGLIYPDSVDVYGIPLFPQGGGNIVVESYDTLNPYKCIPVEQTTTGQFCGASLIYTDTELPIHSCKRKIFRNWEFFEWHCSEEVAISSVQTIEIIDDTAPHMICPDDHTVNITNGCEADIDFLPAIVEDICDPDVTVTIEFGNGTIYDNGGSGLMLGGDNIVTYIAKDRCDNVDTCTVHIDVQDYTPPLAICEDGKIVSLSNGVNGLTKVPATIFDNGSYDDCKIDSIHVRRSDSSCHPDAMIWSEDAYFCCMDAAVPEVLLDFRVLDSSGNASYCQVYVVVQDKTAPVITCPPSVTVDCNLEYDEHNLGPVFGYADVEDNCGDRPLFEVLEKDYNQCGVGTFRRKIQSLGPDGNPTASCDQIITVGNSNPFTEHDIIWPLDLEVNDICDATTLTPDQLEEPFAYPRFVDEEEKCALLGMDYEDHPFSFDPSSGECRIIKRIWTVLNWCGPVDSLERFTIPTPQLIKVNNRVAPEMDLVRDLEFVSQNGDCEFGQVDVVRSAIDDCDDNLLWSYHIKEISSGDTIVSGNSHEIHGKFPVGNYVIYWVVSDRCGNRDTHTQFMNVITDKAPTPLCLNGISVTIGEMDLDGDGIPESQMVRLWASDLDAGSYPGCSGEILVSFSEEITDNNILFDCTQLGSQRVDLWVTDLSTGANDFCTGTVEVQDPNGLCDFESVVIEGNVYTETSRMVEDVEVNLVGANDFRMTDDSGGYAFANMPVGGSYVIDPVMDTNYLNGVSTVDLIMIQRHILGIQRLDSPYKLIAADVNNNERVNGVDLVELRKLILGVYLELPHNNSWRFINTDHVFNDPTDPWLNPIGEDYIINALTGDMTIDFIGVKIGDVNDDVATAQSNDISLRNSGPGFYVMHPSMEAGEESVISVYANNFDDILGWQGTFEFHSEVMEIISVDGKALQDFTEGHYNMSNQDQGWMTMCYDSQSAIGQEKDQVLFEIKVKAKTHIDESENLIELTSAVTNAVAYDTDLEGVGIGVINNSASASRIISVSPNPWVSEADIHFEMNEGGPATFEFFDINGRLIYSAESYYGKGINKFKVRRSNLDVNGLVYIRMKTAGQISDYRMMIYNK